MEVWMNNWWAVAIRGRKYGENGTKENRSRMRGGGDVGEKKVSGKRAKEENLRGAVTQTHSSPPFAIRGTADRDRVTVSHQSWHFAGFVFLNLGIFVFVTQIHFSPAAQWTTNKRTAQQYCNGSLAQTKGFPFCFVGINATTHPMKEDILSI